MMSMPQPTGILIPQIPTPRMNSHVTDTKKIINMKNATLKPASQPFGVFSGGVRGTSPIFAEIDV